MTYLEPTFQEEFRLADDDETLAIDFWAYINARQANLGWAVPDDRVWDCLDEVLGEIKPALADEGNQAYEQHLSSLARRLLEPVEGSDGAFAPESQQVRRELGEMLAQALQTLKGRQAASSNGHGTR